MPTDFNVRAIIFLIVLSVLTFIAHRFGAMNISTSIIDKPNVNFVRAIHDGNLQTTFEHTESGITTKCRLGEVKGFNLCGISVGLAREGAIYGLDLEKYDRIALDLHFSSPMASPKVKVAFRTFDPAYSRINDFVSLKFNAISYNPLTQSTPITVPFNAFQVENWWLAQYKIPFEYSQVDFSNVSFLEFITHSMPIAGDYEITVKSAVLYGQLITEMELLKVILISWLLAATALIARQRNRFQVISNTDMLTSLLNRRGMQIWVQNKLTRYFAHQQLTMYYIDIDDFKQVNDTFGHQVGDELLVAFSERIKGFLAQCNDFKGGAFSRLSGDEFTILFVDLPHDQVNFKAKQLINSFAVPIEVGPHTIKTNISIGIAKSESDVNSFEDLMTRADSAMYYAKQMGKNQFKRFDDTVSKDIFFRKQVSEKIKQTLSNDEFHLHFMPILDSQTLTTSRAEVLLRSSGEALQGIGPDIFIPVAEQYGLIYDIDLWVIEAAFKQLNQERVLVRRNKLVLCINISAAELHNVEFTNQLKGLLDRYKIDPAWVELEITETSLIETDELSTNILNEIREMGIKLALDDFGTGYTAFSQLINYPVDYLKIDKSFIDNLNDKDHQQTAMIKAILSIAKSYNLQTVAEGIETHAQYHYLNDLGCTFMQGYLFSQPLEWHDFVNFMQNNPHIKLDKVSN